MLSTFLMLMRSQSRQTSVKIKLALALLSLNAMTKVGWTTRRTCHLILAAHASGGRSTARHTTVS
jgi:hypothetical protein